MIVCSDSYMNEHLNDVEKDPIYNKTKNSLRTLHETDT